MGFVDFANVYEMARATAERHPDREAYRTLVPPDRSESVTWSQFLQQVRRVGKSLIALDVGHGDKISILSYTCYRWVLTDVGTESVGAVTVGIYHSDLAEGVRYIVDHSDSVLVFAQNRDQLVKLIEVRARIPGVRKVVLFEGSHDDEWVITYEEFLALGDGVGEAALDTRIAAVGPNDPGAIVYTSGTTGVPKGAVLTHDNITWTPQSVQHCASFNPGEVQLLFLPLAHIFARTCTFTALLTATATAFARGIDTIAEDFKTVRPEWFIAVPRIYEKVYSKIISGVEAAGGAKLKIFRWALQTGHAVSDCLLAKRPVPPGLRLRYAIATKLVFSKIQAALGGRVRWCISGAAPLNPAIGKFFHSAGVLILEGLGMTENTSFTNVNRETNYRFGWVGPAGPGVEQRISPEGEIQYRGRNVMREYYKMPAETQETFTDDGWLRTGDLGEIDAAGFLRVTGRKKELIITAGGKNIAPTAIEVALVASKYISQACVIGDRRPYLVALVNIDLENVEAYAREHGIPFATPADLPKEPRIQALIEAEVAERNAQFASFESDKKVAIVEDFTIDNKLLTPTLKLKRGPINERHSEVIDSMYGELF